MSPITIGVFVTFGFVLLGVLGKAIAHGWKWDDVYLGMEMALTTISWSVIYAFDLSRQLRMEAGVANNSADIKNLSNLLQWNTAFLVAALICYFLIAHIHRWWERHPT